MTERVAIACQHAVLDADVPAGVPVLALDAAAARWSVSHGAPLWLLGDLLDRAALAALRTSTDEERHRIEELWSSRLGSGDAASFRPEDDPYVLDAVAGARFRFDALHASLRSRGFEVLGGPPGCRVGLDQYFDHLRFSTSAVCLGLPVVPRAFASDSSRLGAAGESPPTGPAGFLASVRRRLVHPSQRARTLGTADTSDVRTIPRGQILVVTWLSELRRVLPQVQSLIEAFGDRCTVVLATGKSDSSPRKALKQSEKRGVPIAGRPPAPRARVERERARVRRSLWPHLVALDPSPGPGSLADRLAARWGLLRAETDWWRSVWVDRAPAAVLTTRGLAEGVLPAVASSGLGIPTFTIPHGLIEADGLHRRSAIQHLGPFESGGRSNGSPGVIATRGLTSAIPYPDTAPGPDPTDAPRRLLILADSWFAEGERVEDVVSGLASIVGACERTGHRPALREHPGGGELLRSLLTAAVTSQLERAHPRSPLEAWIAASAGIVLFGDCGSAAVHAIRSGLPVLRWRRPPLSRFQDPVWRSALSLLPTAATEAEVVPWLRAVGGPVPDRTDLRAARDMLAAGSGRVPDLVERVEAAVGSTSPWGR